MDDTIYAYQIPFLLTQISTDRKVAVFTNDQHVLKFNFTNHSLEVNAREQAESEPGEGLCSLVEDTG